MRTGNDRQSILLSAEPLVDYVEKIRHKTNGDIRSLAAYFGVSERHFSRYFGIRDGSIYAKVSEFELTLADAMLTHAGDETLHNLWNYDELDGNYREYSANQPRCKRCDYEMIKPRKDRLCGFCVEETTGRTLTYRQREMY